MIKLEKVDTQRNEKEWLICHSDGRVIIPYKVIADAIKVLFIIFMMFWYGQEQYNHAKEMIMWNSYFTAISTDVKSDLYGCYMKLDNNKLKIKCPDREIDFDNIKNINYSQG